MVEFSRPEEEERAKEFTDLQKKKEESLKEFEKEKDKELDELRRREVVLEALRREKEEAEKKLKSLLEKEKEKSKELDEEEKRLKEQAEALAQKIEREAEELERLRTRPGVQALEEVVAEAAPEVETPQVQVQTVYQPPPGEGEVSFYQRLANIRAGIYHIAQHKVSSTMEEVWDEQRAQVGVVYRELQDIVKGLADNASRGRVMDESDAVRNLQALNTAMQAVSRLEGSPIGEMYQGRMETLINVAAQYLSKRQDDLYKTGV